MEALTRKGHSRADLHGYSIVPLLTPATPQGDLDEQAVTRIVEHVVAGGCQGMIVCGTTGEFASMPVEMRVRMMNRVAAANRGRAVLFGGTGDTSPVHSLALADAFFQEGADAVVLNLPSYYPLTPEMMEQYFLRLADGIEGPIYLYNIPQTTRQSIPLDVVERLSQHPRIAGIKDSEPDRGRQVALARMFAGRPDFAVFCGSVALASHAFVAGADGFVPGAGNFVPALTRRLMDDLVAGDAESAEATQARIDTINAVYQKGRLISQVFAALKAIMELHELCGRHVFSPLLSASDAEVEVIRGQLVELGLIQ